MSGDNGKKLSRRALLKGFAIAAAGAAMGSALLWSRQADAAKAAKDAVKYRDTPDGDHQCSNCLHFIPGSSPTGKGQCNVVAGDISPTGWCVAWAAKKS